MYIKSREKLKEYRKAHLGSMICRLFSALDLNSLNYNELESILGGNYYPGRIYLRESLLPNLNIRLL